MNKYTIGKVTVGLSNYLNKTSKNASVVIAYDTRNNSYEFAQNTALILNHYGIKTYLFKEVTSTPELSFSIKKLNCKAGIVITSSHNEKIYNGYKVYNEFGGQIVPPEDDLIIKEVNCIEDFEMIKYAPKNNELFNYVPDEIHELFIEENLKVIINKNLIEKYNNDIKITYSSLHGVGLKTAKEIFSVLGFNNYNIVKEQCTYDGNFPFAPKPNPEYIENYDLAIKYAKENDSDIILITDPDADRLGVMYKNSNNEYELINGDLLGAIYANYIINNKNTENSYVIRSIVTSNFIDKIAKSKNIDVYEVLTGCKNIANKRRQIKDKNYLFGYEESLGYMFDIDVNDKNSFSSIVCILEILCFCKSENITLNDYINDLLGKFNYQVKETINIDIKDINYKEIIDNIMKNFRNKTYDFNNKNYKLIDYLNEVGEKNTNALKYIFDDDSTIMIRPSGTEPKIKIYIVSQKENLNEIKNEISRIINV